MLFHEDSGTRYGNMAKQLSLKGCRYFAGTLEQFSLQQH